MNMKNYFEKMKEFHFIKTYQMKVLCYMDDKVYSLSKYRLDKAKQDLESSKIN